MVVGVESGRKGEEDESGFAKELLMSPESMRRVEGPHSRYVDNYRN